MRRTRTLLAAALAFLCVLGGLFSWSRHRARNLADGLPNLILWAWERPEDFRELPPGEAGVAFLAETIYLREPQAKTGSETDPDVRVRPRRQPLRIAPGTALIAVVRIESVRSGQPRANAADGAPAYADEQRQLIAKEIASLQDLDGVRAVEIDFDATAAERGFYAALLGDVRGRLRQEVPLEITALASWCLGDPWLAQLPPGTIAEAVPMLFRMGADTGEVARKLGHGEEFSAAACRGSAGLSTDEEFSRDLLSGNFNAKLPGQAQKRIYLFHPRPWSKADAEHWIAEVRQWHER